MNQRWKKPIPSEVMCESLVDSIGADEFIEILKKAYRYDWNEFDEELDDKGSSKDEAF